MSERKKWIHDPSSKSKSSITLFKVLYEYNFPDDLCKPLNCKKKELCLLEDAYTAVCVSKKELHKNRFVRTIIQSRSQYSPFAFISSFSIYMFCYEKGKILLITSID